MFLEILKACYLDHYRLKLWFNFAPEYLHAISVSAQ